MNEAEEKEERGKLGDITTIFFKSQGELRWWFQCALLFTLT